MKPRFTVLMPAHNRENLIGAAIHSVLSQKFTDFEIIVVDDGSKDGTKEVLHSFGPRIKTIFQANQGAEIARARGLTEAKGEYLVFLDDDDLLMPWSLGVYDRVIRELGSPPVILGGMIHFENGAKPCSQGGDESFIDVLKYKDYLSKELPLGLSYSRIVMQKSLYDASARIWSSFMAYPLDDDHLMLSIGTASPCVLVTRPTTIAHRVHADNISQDVELIVKTLLSLIQLERQGLYPGGGSRRCARYSCIGGLAWFWGKKALKRGHYALGLGLLVKSCPHLAAGAIKKLRVRVRRAAVPMRLPR